MSQSVSHNNFNDTTTTSRRYTGFPLNSTLVSSYTPDTIRSIISHAAAGQPYSTPVWIRLSRVGIQVSAQDAQIARTRIPVFIPIGLAHDIFMLPSINNVICVVYDEVQSNMKGVLLYVVHPSDAQSIREDFRIAKQAHTAQQQQNTHDTRHSNTSEIYSSENVQLYSPISHRSPLFNNQTIRQPSPQRIVYVRNNETNPKRELTPAFPQLSYTSSKGSYHSDRRRNRSPKRHRSGHSPTKRSSDSGLRSENKTPSQSLDKPNQTKLPTSRSSPDLAQEEIKQQQLQQQQQLLLQQQQLAAWQAQQQAQQQQPQLIPMGIYNRYVPKTIPLPTGETLKTTLPPPGIGGPALNGTAVAYIEPIKPANTQQQPSRSRSRSISPPSQQQNRLPTGQSSHHRHHHRRHHTIDPNSQSVRVRSKHPPTTPDIDDVDEETKQYLKVLVEEMQAMKLEMNRLRQVTASGVKGRSDSLQVDLKEIRSHIDHIRSRMGATPRLTTTTPRNPTPRIPEKTN